MSYFAVYFSFYAALLVLLFLYLFVWKSKIPDRAELIGCAFLIIAISLYFGFRGNSIGSDTDTYISLFSKNKVGNNFKITASNWYSLGIVFYGLFYLSAPFMPAAVLFTLFSLFSLSSYFLLLSADTEHKPFPVLVLILGLFFVIAANINVIRIGLALSFFFLFLYLNNKGKWFSWLLLPVAVLTHLTILLIILPYFISKWLRPIGVYYGLFGVALLFAVFNLGILDVPLIRRVIAASPHFDYYLTNPTHYHTGFRLSFTLFNGLFIVLGYFAYHKKENPFYFRMYLLITALFLSLYGMIASDRIGLFSWFLIPLIVLDFSSIPYFSGIRQRNAVYFSAVVLLAGISCYLIMK